MRGAHPGVTSGKFTTKKRRMSKLTTHAQLCRRMYMHVCVCEHSGISPRHPGAIHTCMPCLPTYAVSVLTVQATVCVCLCAMVLSQMQKSRQSHKQPDLVMQTQESRRHSTEIPVIPVLQWGGGIQHNSVWQH